jgi:hypothetical protein
MELLTQETWEQSFDLLLPLAVTASFFRNVAQPE